MRKSMNWRAGKMRTMFVLTLCFLCFFSQNIFAQETEDSAASGQQTVQTTAASAATTAEETSTSETSAGDGEQTEAAEAMTGKETTTASTPTEEEAAATTTDDRTAASATGTKKSTIAAKSTGAKSASAKKKKAAKKKPTIRITKKKVSLEKGDTIRLKAKIKHSSTKKIIWKSSKKRVATVNKKGKVTAKNKGKTKITARISGTKIKATCVVTVKKYITMRVRTTGYCNCSRCAGQWAGCRTASGTVPKENRTIAVDKHLISLGTKVKIGDEMYVAEDTGGAIKGKRIDIYYASHSRAMAHGVKYQNVKVYYK